MWWLGVIFIVLFVCNYAFMEYCRRKSYDISDFFYRIHIALFIGLFAFSEGVIKYQISSDRLFYSVDDIISLICTFVFIVIVGIRILFFVWSYKRVKNITMRLSEKFHVVCKYGIKNFHELIYAFVDDKFCYSFYGAWKGLSKEVSSYFQKGYIDERFSKSNIKLSIKYLDEYVYMIVQIWMLPYYEELTQEWFEVFLYCEKQIQLRNEIKSIIPRELFEYHNYLNDNATDRGWRQYESYLIEELVFNYSDHSKYNNKIEILNSAKKSLNKKLIHDWDKKYTTIYINDLINYIRNN